MSERKAKVLGKTSLTNSSPNSDEMTREQALAVSWTGLEALARLGQLIICNDKTTGHVWFGIANAKVLRVGTDKAGQPMYDLIDKTLPTLEALAVEAK